jgi:hypothetical protein
MTPMELSDFPSDELEKLHEVCSEYNVNPVQFFIYATIPRVDAADMTLLKRIVYVEYIITTQQQEYPAARQQNRPGSFAKDLESGFYAGRQLAFQNADP